MLNELLEEVFNKTKHIISLKEVILKIGAIMVDNKVITTKIIIINSTKIHLDKIVKVLEIFKVLV